MQARPCSLAFETGVSKALVQMESVLLSHGISKLAPKGCGPFVAREHAVVSTSASGKLPADGETVMVAETLRAGYRHDATGAILRRAKVGLAPAQLAALAVPSSASQSDERRGAQRVAGSLTLTLTLTLTPTPTPTLTRSASPRSPAMSSGRTSSSRDATGSAGTSQTAQSSSSAA